MSDATPRLQSDNPSALPPGTRLGEFEVLSLLGVGGFGIVYLAFDHALEREVAVKEYMPASLAGRTRTLHVSVRSQSDADTFALGLRSFVNEARLLARFDHPSLLKVHRFWEANGTAYMAMPVMRGRTVKEVRAEMSQPPDEAWLRALLGPLLGAIEKLHSEGVYHRDIAPDNIQIEPDGHPVLLDFGAARRVISDKSQTLTAILKPAYAPIEQYAEVGAVRQGPWTDIYALGATLHYLLLHRPPPPATARTLHDDASAITTEACPGCSETFLRTIDWMLAPRPTDRPQSVAALREVLDGHAQPPRRRVDTQPPPSQWDRTVVLDAAQATTTIAPRTVPLSAPVPAPSPSPSPPSTDLEFDDDRTRVLPQPVAMAVPPAPAAPVPAAGARSGPAAPATAAAAAPPARSPTPAAMDFAAPPVSTMQAGASAPPGGRPKWLPLAAGGAVAALAAAAVVLWPRAPATAPAGVDTAPAAASAAAAAASLVVPDTILTTPPASAVPESAVTTVVVPARPAPAATPPAAQTPDVPAADTKPPAPRPQSPARQPPPVSTAPPQAAPAPLPAASRLPEPARAATPAPAPPAAVAPPVTAPVEPPKPAVVAGPEAKCSGRNPISYFVCMERECLRSEFGSHLDCLKWRAEARRENRN
jgi:serine/threonine protein kinase